MSFIGICRPRFRIETFNEQETMCVCVCALVRDRFIEPFSFSGSLHQAVIDESLALLWPVTTHGCEAWTLRKQEERRIQAFENKCIRKLLRIPWTKLMTTAQVYKMAGTDNERLNHIKSLKLRYFGHVMRQPHDNVEGSVMVGLVEGLRNRGRQRMCWLSK